MARSFQVDRRFALPGAKTHGPWGKLALSQTLLFFLEQRTKGIVVILLRFEKVPWWKMTSLDFLPFGFP
jgi:hypothetical protein